MAAPGAIMSTHETAARERVKRIMEDGFNVSVDKTRIRDLPEWFDETLFTR